MIPEIGHFALILALVVAVVQTVVPLLGSALGNPRWIGLAKPATWLQLLFMVIAYACLTYAFITHDFSVKYVASNSHTTMPLLYRVSGVWGAHEGSLLLWALILSLWAGAVSVFSRSIPAVMLARVLGVMGFVGVGFLLFLLVTSNPFTRLLPAPVDGRSLNPLLQDPGLAIHPPMLYMGYVGFSVAFAFAVAAMLGGKLDAAWTRWVRPWTNVAWMFLTLGIALGSWWAYYELGWGGWWFWDPVENASLMPWLVGTALIHSLAVSEKRGAFKAWTVLLAIFAFSLSLLGTFLVRSGVLTSVHAFATDPGRGLFILLFLLTVVGLSLTLYAFRAKHFTSSVRFHLVSRETGLLLNNVILVVMAATILLGTLYPLVMDALGIGKISVGPPYFNSVIVPLGIPLVIVMGLGVLLRWKRDSFSRLGTDLILLVVIALGVGLLFSLLLHYDWEGMAAVGLIMATWIAATTIFWAWRQKRTASVWGAALAHIGMAITIIGISLTSLYSSEKDVRLSAGQQYQLAGYDFQFQGVKKVTDIAFDAYQGAVNISRGGQPISHLEPQKRVYRVQTMPMTEAGIDAGLFRDLFVALGEPLEGGAWSLRLYHKPFIRWIWIGAIFMAMGGLLAASDRRYRLKLRRTDNA
jgi:cytochrome c-type biogenesis protein CcmF